MHTYICSVCAQTTNTGVKQYSLFTQSLQMLTYRTYIKANIKAGETAPAASTASSVYR